MDLSEKLAAAWARRDQLHGDPGTNAYRLFHGHGDGEPGLDVDRFGSAVVLWLRQPLDLDVSALCDFYEKRFGPELIIAKEGARDPGRVLLGSAPETAITVQEDGLYFGVDLLAAQNAGLFLDARPARRWLRTHSEGRRIANLFAYTGSLGIAAFAGQALSIEHVDLQSGQLRRARLNHELNDQRVSDRDFQVLEAGRWLRQAVKKGRSFDGVILDPPPRSPKGRASFRRERLYELAVKVLRREGWLLVFFNRRGLDLTEEEHELLTSTGGQLERFWEGVSGPDFFEKKSVNRLHFGAYRRC